ncbi:MAG: SpoIID/LytB domain-containing protein, partial [Calditrichaeota bacterium]
MLVKNAIPSEEPVIDVGIVLPEDETRKVALILPGDTRYRMVFGDHSQKVEGGGPVTVQLEGDRVVGLLPGGQTVAGEELTLEPISSSPLGPKSGVEVKNVIAGRGFHWKKRISVFLPGQLIFRPFDGQLLLVNRLAFEDYLACVTTSEMGPACPAAYIEAQAIAARSWMLANVEQKHRALGIDVCNDDCCQRYQGTTYLTRAAMQAALHTRGQVLMFNGTICDARYSKSCGGMMEAFENIWAGDAKPYLIVKPDMPEEDTTFQPHLEQEQAVRKWVKQVPPAFCSPQVIPETELGKYLGGVDERAHYFRWSFSVSQHEMTQLLNRKLHLDAEKMTGFRPLKRGGSGRITQLAIDYISASSQPRQFVLQ